MKKLLAIFAVILLTVCIVGCGGKNAENGQSGVQQVDLSDEDLALSAAQSLNVPDSDSITYKIGEKLYWEAANVYYKNVTFYENGKMVASADVNTTNGEPLKSMYLYEK